MKLAEALQERADLNRKIEELRRRLNNCILVQEGEEPAEDPAALLKELDSAADRLETLMAQINLTNCRTKVQGTAGQNTQRARGTEIKVRSVLRASELQAEVDALAREIRLLDNLLQETNWKTRLIEK